jgi:hypothetical protein
MNRFPYRARIAVAAFAALGTLHCAGDMPSQTDDANETVQLQERTATLVGIVLDWNDQPVANAEVFLAVNGHHVGDAVMTDDRGFYRLPANVDAIEEGYRLNQEVTVLVYSPLEDLGPQGTFEGDRIHLLPITLREFTDVTTLADGATAQLRTAYVPLQAPGYAITDDLIANGGELVWTVPNPNGAGMLDVTLILEPGAIQLDGAEPQREITMTFLDAERAPMQIPNDGTGVLWTIQPRDVRFDPPARLRIEGERMGMVGGAEVAVGEAFPIFGASLDRGWQLYGDSEITSLDGDTMVIETPEGIIHRGAWGHVLSDPNSDAGMLVTCQNEDTGNYVVCAVLGQRIFDESGLGDLGLWTNVSRDQADFTGEPDRLFWYTDKEIRCSGCTNIGAAEAQLATNLDLGLPEDDGTPVFVVVTELCASEVGNQIDARDQILTDRVAAVQLVITEQSNVIDPGAGAGSTPRTELWETFCSDDYADGACPPFDPAAIDVGRRQFTREFTFLTSAAHCDENDRQAGNPGHR